LSDQSAELVRRARRGEAAAFEQLITLHENAALAVAYARTRDAHLAGDATQDAFLKAWRQLANLQDESRFGPWLLQIVRNAATDLLRRQKPTADDTALHPVPDDQPSPMLRLATEDDRQRLRDALATLDQLTRDILIMRYFDDRPSKEIAALLDLSPAAVDMRLSRGRAQLKTLLETPPSSRLASEVKSHA